MSVYDYDEPDEMGFAPPPKRPRSKKSQDDEKRRAVIPVLPQVARLDPDDIDMRGGVTKLDEAVVSMRIDGAPFEEIARVLSLPSAEAAYTRMVAALAKTHPREDWETLRNLEVARAEQLMRRSFAMAEADFFVDAEDPTVMIPNTEKLRWHQQAGQDLALHATITGAKAPTRVEITPTDQEYDALVTEVLRARGHVEPKEYNILAIEDIQDAEVVEGES